MVGPGKRSPFGDRGGHGVGPPRYGALGGCCGSTYIFKPYDRRWVGGWPCGGIIGEAKRRASTDDDVVKDPINREKKVIEIYQSEDNTVEEIGRRLVGYTSTYDDTTSNMQGFVGYQLMPGTYLLQKQ